MAVTELSRKKKEVAGWRKPNEGALQILFQPMAVPFKWQTNIY